MLVEDTANLSSYIEDCAPSSLASIFLLFLARIRLLQAPAGSATQKTMRPLYHHSPRRMPALPTKSPRLRAPVDEHWPPVTIGDQFRVDRCDQPSPRLREPPQPMFQGKPFSIVRNSVCPYARSFARCYKTSELRSRSPWKNS